MYDLMTNDQLAEALAAAARRGGSIRPIIAAAEKRGLKLRVTVRNAATGFDPDHDNLSSDDDDAESDGPAA